MAVIIFSWGAPVPGRESRALEVYRKAASTWESLVAEGRIRGYREAVRVHGDPIGPAREQIIEGTLDELRRVQHTVRFELVMLEAEALYEEFGLRFVTDEEAAAGEPAFGSRDGGS